MVPWSKAPNKLHVCAQLLRLLAFTEHGKATEIKHCHWYSYIDIQNYSQCWEILGGREENRNAWVLTTLHTFLWPNSKKASWSACFYQTSSPPASPWHQLAASLNSSTPLTLPKTEHVAALVVDLAHSAFQHDAINYHCRGKHGRVAPPACAGETSSSPQEKRVHLAGEGGLGLPTLFGPPAGRLLGSFLHQTAPSPH